MPKFKSVLFTAGAIFATVSAQAASPCCASSAGASASAAPCEAVVSTLGLPAEQEAKLSALAAACVKEGCSSASQEKFLKAAAELVTPDQLSKLKSECEKQGS